MGTEIVPVDTSSELSVTTPNARIGIDVPCARCMALPGQLCRSNSGRTLKETHMSRMRAELEADPVRAYISEQTSWRRSS